MTGVAKVNIAVCGKFHYLNYANDLVAMERLNRLYFSHKRETPQRFGLDPDHTVNAFLKEYLMQGSRRIFGDRIAKWSDPLTGRLWARQVLHRWSPAGILHFLAHGHALPLVSRARADGAKVVAEMVNTHHSNQLEVYLRECEHWKVRPHPTVSAETNSRIDEEGHSADLILVPAEHVRQSFIKKGFDASRLVKIPFGANLGLFYSNPQPKVGTQADGPLRVVCVGQIGLRKGQLYLLEAARQLGPEIIDLTLIGQLNWEVEALVGRYRGEFRHIAHIEHAELRRFLRTQDVFVLPSLEEGMAFANCEALATGLCVVTTEPSGAGEIIRNGENGFLIEPGSTEAIIDQLLKLHGDRDLVRAVGETAAHDMQVFNGWSEYAKKLDQLYERLLS